MAENLDEVETRHRKEIKALDGEKRASLKKSKATAGKGKKGKAVLEALEAEFEGKLKEMKNRHALELEETREISDGGAMAAKNTAAETASIAPAAETTAVSETNSTPDPVEDARQRKIEKARRKREKARQKEIDRQEEIEKETAEAGPSARDVEMKVITSRMADNLSIQPVEADGNCLYRAVAAQCGKSYQEMRSLCADTLQSHPDEFSPFCEYTGDIPDFSSYIETVRSSSEWGGHLELRALSIALKRPIIVYSAQSMEPLVVEEQGSSTDDPIRLSYHLQYYSLGEHYNRVVLNSS